MTTSSTSLGLELPAPVARGSGASLLFSALRAQRGPALLGVVSGVAWSLAKLTAPTLVRRGIDLGIRGRDSRQLAAAVAGLLLVGVVQAGLAGFRRYFAISLAARVETDLRARLFVHVLRLDLAFHARTPAGQKSPRIATRRSAKPTGSRTARTSPRRARPRPSCATRSKPHRKPEHDQETS